MDEPIKVYALTTIDNPFDPFDDFDKWYAFDIAHGYDSCGYLARIARTSDKFSEEDQEREIQRAIDEIVKLNINGMYTKVARSD
jgi:hypothetical protein